MLSRNAATLDKNNDNPLQNNIYVYKGGKIDDADNPENVRVDESVPSIDDKAFNACEKLRTVQFSTNNTIKKIGNEGFYFCNNLSSIDLQGTQIKSIGESAFCQCENLATVQFPSSVRKIGISCFYRCYQLQVVDLSHVDYLEAIEDSAFARCSALTTINLPPKMSSIGKESFYWCKALETLDLRATCVKEIGERAFSCCKNLSSIYFPTMTKCIGRQSFHRCKKLANLDLQATSVERIGASAFCGCGNLTMVNFPKTLKYIEKLCFSGCTKLKYLSLNETSIERIGDDAFSCCTNLAMVVGISTSHRGEQLQENMGDYGSMILPASLVEVGEDAFDECPVLQNRINNNWLQYQCDVNRGGRRFLKRDHHHHGNNNDGDAKRHDRVYHSSLWALILYRVMNEMKLPTHSICPNNDDLTLYTNANPVQRRASVVFYLLVHGVVADLRPQPQAQSENVQATQTQAAALTSSLSSLVKKRKAQSS